MSTEVAPNEDTLRACEIIRGVKELLGPDMEAWTTGKYASDEDGNEVAPTSRAAVHFCLVGALERVAGVDLTDKGHEIDYLPDPARNAYRFLMDSIHSYVDGTTGSPIRYQYDMEREVDNGWFDEESGEWIECLETDTCSYWITKYHDTDNLYAGDDEPMIAESDVLDGLPGFNDAYVTAPEDIANVLDIALERCIKAAGA